MPDRVRFTETMTGWIGPGDDPLVGEAAGRAAGARSFFTLTVITTDVGAMVTDPEHRSPAFGCAVFPSVFPAPMAVHQGHLDLFVDAGPGRLEMRYGLDLVDGAGHRWRLDGVKRVARRRWFPTVFTDTTTLFVHLRESEGPRRLAGVLYMGPGGVLAQGLTFRGQGRFWGIGAIVSFMRYYIGSVVKCYLF
jgi:hypothetical protein